MSASFGLLALSSAKIYLFPRIDVKEAVSHEYRYIESKPRPQRKSSPQSGIRLLRKPDSKNFIVVKEMPEDALAVCRYQLKELDKNIRSFLTAQADVDLATKAHLENCTDTIAEALK
jgi:hypothetical protein